jgi:hypothetical protein
VSQIRSIARASGCTYASPLLLAACSAPVVATTNDAGADAPSVVDRADAEGGGTDRRAGPLGVVFPITPDHGPPITAVLTGLPEGAVHLDASPVSARA